MLGSTNRAALAVQEVAWFWQATLLLCMLWGHLPPGRTYWFTTMAHPFKLPTSCPEPHCHQVGCQGNVLRLQPDGRYKLEANHHKMSRK